jgi:hypothetical protein
VLSDPRRNVIGLALPVTPVMDGQPPRAILVNQAPRNQVVDQWRRVVYAERERNILAAWQTPPDGRFA